MSGKYIIKRPKILTVKEVTLKKRNNPPKKPSTKRHGSKRFKVKEVNYSSDFASSSSFVEENSFFEEDDVAVEPICNVWF